MTKDTMPKADTGVYKRPRSTRWQWRIKAPADLSSLYPSEWGHRASLDTDDIRTANAKAAHLRAEWLARFDEQRRELNPQKVDSITPEMGQVLAQRVSARLLANDEALRNDPETARALLLAISSAVPSKLTIGPPSLPAWAVDPLDPLDGLPEYIAAELSALNGEIDQRAALQMALQRVSSVLPLALAEGRKLGLVFDAKTPGALAALRECLKATGRHGKQSASVTTAR